MRLDPLLTLHPITGAIRTITPSLLAETYLVPRSSSVDLASAISPTAPWAESHQVAPVETERVLLRALAAAAMGSTVMSPDALLPDALPDSRARRHLAALRDLWQEIGGALPSDPARCPARRPRSSFAANLHASVSLSEREANWEWAGPAWLDVKNASRFKDWLADDNGIEKVGAEDAWGAHVKALLAAGQSTELIGRASEDEMLEHLVSVSLGSPATCALRALSRVAPTLTLDDPAMLTAAAQIAMGFRTLFNQPEAQALLRGSDDGRYWQAVLRYCGDNDLQSVLDEYVHLMVEANGLHDADPARIVMDLADTMVSALSLRPAQIEVQNVAVKRRRLRFDEGFQMRGRFAMRLAPHGEDETGTKRIGIVRTAFNSPFRPFVLASTSIGQEGLDFHPYCHRLIHWNLPTNPVDLEQREGRVHRYKSHAVRLNLAAGWAHVAWRSSTADPWTAMFAAARAAARNDSDLEPYWLCDGDAKVERVSLTLPYSRELTRLGWLKRSVAVYRLAFGQPRQDDFLAWLTDLGGRLPPEKLAELQITLRP